MSTTSNKNGGQFWKYVLIGGVPGILLGSGGTVVAENVVEAANEEDAPLKDETIAEDQAPAEVPVAEVNDEMSFGEAFAAARAEVGAGGVFRWHGNLYNTFTAEEWEAMNAEERAEFGDRVFGVNVTDTENVYDPVEADSIEVVAVEEEGLRVEEIGIVETEEGDQMIVAVGSIDGEPVAFADVDCDGEIDIVADGHGNTYSGEGISVGDLCEIAMADESYGVQEAMYEDTPDYMNDADTTAFA